MSMERTELGRDIETVLREVFDHVRGDTELPGRIVNDPDRYPPQAVRAE